MGLDMIQKMKMPGFVKAIIGIQVVAVIAFVLCLGYLVSALQEQCEQRTVLTRMMTLLGKLANVIKHRVQQPEISALLAAFHFPHDMCHRVDHCG